MVIEYSKRFLWLPKKINNKWYWLKTVKTETKTQRFIVDGKTAYVKQVKYYI